VTVVIILAAVAAFSAWAVRANGSRWSTIPMFFAVAVPTSLALYVAVGLARHAFGI